MTPEEAQRAKDEKLMRDAAILVDGERALRRRVDEARLEWLRKDHYRLKAVVDGLPPAVVARRAVGADEALTRLRGLETYYEEGLAGNAACLRKAAME